MLNLVRAAPLISMLLAIAGSIVVSAPAGWIARGLIVDLIERPALIRQQEERCADRIETAVREGLQAERDRQFQLNEAAWREGERLRQVEDDFKDARLRLLNERIADYESERTPEQAVACGFTERDLDRFGRLQLDTQ